MSSTKAHATQGSFDFYSKNPTISKNYKNRSVKSDVIIQCPNCQTKFSVASDVINEQDNPRFHCSRCDNVFDMDAADTINLDMPRKNSPIEKSVTREEAPFLDIPTFSVDDSELTFTTIENKLATERQTEKQSDFEKPSKSLSMPKEIPGTKAATAPHHHLMANEKEKITIGFTEDKQTPDPGDLPYGYSVGSSFSNKKEEKQTLSKEAEEILAAIEAKQINKAASEKVTSYAMHNQAASAVESSWQGFLLLAVPLLGTLALISAACYYLMSAPDMAEKMVASISSNLEQFPPAGMNIQKIKFNKVTLDSGESMNTISGIVTNNSKQNFKEVMVEGLAFDSAGKVLTSTKLDLGSTLADKKIKSMPLEMIKSIQSTKAAKRKEIKAGESVDFTIGLLDDQADAKPSYFSARILSVKN